MVGYNCGKSFHRELWEQGQRPRGPQAWLQKTSWRRLCGIVCRVGKPGEEERKGILDSETTVVMETELGSCMECSGIERNLG